MEFESLHSDFFKLLDNIAADHMDKLETVVEQYFSSCFPGSNIEYDDKAGGAFLSTRVKVDLLGREMRKYPVKTHSAERFSAIISTAQIYTLKMFILPHWMQVMVEVFMHLKKHQEL